MSSEFSGNAVVSLRDVTVRQDIQTVLERASFEIEKGEFVYLVGRTGSGKSSLLKTLYADLPLAGGQLSVAGFNLHKLARQKVPYLRRKVGIVFQDFQLLFDRSVTENLTFVLKATGWKDKKKIKHPDIGSTYARWSRFRCFAYAAPAFGRGTAAHCNCPRPA
jgi:cell division transport system ATP-binding protein